ncbi:MAG: hypothetical protein AAF901_01650 [Bacteroidota bacterium]
MRKKVYSLLLVILFVSSSLNASGAIPESEYGGACKFYAEWMGYVFAENGLNYYEGYFGAYADCLEKLGAGGL